jgi:hypothetical protein
MSLETGAEERSTLRKWYDNLRVLLYTIILLVLSLLNKYRNKDLIVCAYSLLQSIDNSTSKKQ